MPEAPIRARSGSSAAVPTAAPRRPCPVPCRGGRPIPRCPSRGVVGGATLAASPPRFPRGGTASPDGRRSRRPSAFRPASTVRVEDARIAHDRPNGRPMQARERRNPRCSRGFREYRHGDSNPGFRRERVLGRSQWFREVPSRPAIAPKPGNLREHRNAQRCTHSVHRACAAQVLRSSSMRGLSDSLGPAICRRLEWRQRYLPIPSDRGPRPDYT